ncbi:sensor histidine kinase [Kitasatospora sp. NPDC051984]|uniref:sensor histidine kinase n=1 Tax=Kitasatospora sp. NPDC051984 TaxID=3364059 RepID=UPI0037CBACB8
MTVRRALTAVAAVLLLVPAVLGPPAGWIPGGTAVLVLALAALHRPLGPSSPVLAPVAAALLSLAVDAGYFGDHGLELLWMPAEFAALLALVVRAVRRLPARPAWAAGALTTAAALALPLRFALRQPVPLDASVAGLVIAVAPVATALGAALYLRGQDDRRARAVRDARHEQRLAVARDLHDYVAHELTGILLEVQAAQVSGYGPDENARLLTRLEAAGQRALASMDHTLDTLRAPDDAAPRRHALTELPALLDHFPDRPALHHPADLPALPPAVEDAAYRVALEALTNIRRHAPAADRITVAVAHHPGTGLTVTVTDTGPAHPHARPGGGTGLTALRTRIADLGGELTAGPHGTGWRVAATLPTG